MKAQVRSGTLVGRQFASYEVLALLGSGGMGEVYRARDTRLGREVGLKVLHSNRAANPEHQARFRREAQAASALNHPNILTVYDVGVEDGVSFIVTELIDGVSIRERVERGPLPIKTLLDLATQIAEGLTAAHEADIVHRDLKPENVMVTKHGRVKILDFGLALAPIPMAPGDGTAQITRTETALIQGTVPYMSPEQARGEAGDSRSDQFAFGLMLYEMTTGVQAFRRDSPAQTLSAIIADEAPAIAASARAPLQLPWLIERLLAKDPSQRYAATRDLAQDLRTLRDRLPEAATISAPAAARPRWAVGALLIAVTVVALAVGADIWVRLPPADLPLSQFEVSPPKAATFPSSAAFMTVSPDGRSLAFIASSPDGPDVLWLRPFDSPAARPFLGTEGASQPFWSADSKFLAIGISDQVLKKVNVSSGVVETLDQGVGSGAWNADNVIIGPRSDDGGTRVRLYRISAAGGSGSATPVTTLDAARGEIAHRWPYFLPDGRHFLYIAESRQPEFDGILCAGSLDSTERTFINLSVESNVAYVAPGYLLYMKTNTLFAVPFDANALRATGEPVVIAEHVERTPGRHRGGFSVSQAGAVLAYRLIGETQLTWFDRGGRPGVVISSGALFGNPSLSPDERRVAVNRFDPATGTQDIWLIDAVRGVASRITLDPPNEPSDELKPLWFADGSGRLAYRSNRRPPQSQPAGPGFYGKALGDNGLGDLMQGGVSPFGSPLGWFRGALLYEAWDQKTHMDLWTLPAAGDRTPVPFLHTQADEAQGQLSPDERWIAYVSDETKRPEVYVRPFPSGDDKWLVSRDGGIEPQWARDGTELFYLAPDQWLMAVTMKTGRAIEPGVAKRLFRTRMAPAADHGYTRNQYAVTKDGRFLINQPESPAPITVVLNWTALLKR